MAFTVTYVVLDMAEPLRRRPSIPLDRLRGAKLGDPAKLQELKKLRVTRVPFKLSQIIEQKLDRIFELANARYLSAPYSTPSASLSTSMLAKKLG